MLDSKQIEAIIPHRYPFLLVDRIIELHPGASAIGEKDVLASDFFFPGHFPNEPVMPGVLIIESLAQTGAVALLSAEENKNKSVYFAGIRHAKFRRKVIPGDTLRLEVELKQQKKQFGLGKSKAYVGEALACEAEFTFIYF
ncbi:MAG: 3-hydroxyacyl-ACP dehydratase FabZ [Bacilli bacterium]|nr:3-hydroxyacyl-ACP dehydratase FabZ [Bacilli bacterium]MBN2696595.1 3-hydroxyacyl-ACP dehydratase FabZ [Bacilli bacterium]